MAKFAYLKSLICVATPFEGTRLRDRLRDTNVRVIETGVGPVNAAHAVTVAIINDRPEQIVVCGVGGAYPSSGLMIGDVVCAESEIYGDLGAGSPSGFLDMAALGFAVVSTPGPLFNELPLQIFPVERRTRFVTVSTCSGTDQAAREMERRTSGAVENMEGAAIAHVALMHGVPAAEIRGISNLVTNRDKASWRLAEAAEAAQNAVIEYVSRL